MQASIIALYGPKPDALRAMLASYQATATQLLGTRFHAYDIDQIHATLVGLERTCDSLNAFENRNFKRLRALEIAMDFDGLIDGLRQSLAQAIPVQIGGFADRDYPFTSRGERPFMRSFSIQGRNVVLTGWPRQAIDGSRDTDGRHARPGALHSLRVTTQKFGVLHAYHRRSEDVDDDLYLRLGTLEVRDSPQSVTTSHVENVIRRQLAARVPLQVNIGLSNTYIAFYDSPELPLATTRPYRLDDARVCGELIRRRLSMQARP